MKLWKRLSGVYDEAMAPQNVSATKELFLAVMTLAFLGPFLYVVLAFATEGISWLRDGVFIGLDKLVLSDFLNNLYYGMVMFAGIILMAVKLIGKKESLDTASYMPLVFAIISAILERFIPWSRALIFLVLTTLATPFELISVYKRFVKFTNVPTPREPDTTEYL